MLLKFLESALHKVSGRNNALWRSIEDVDGRLYASSCGPSSKEGSSSCLGIGFSIVLTFQLVTVVTDHSNSVFFSITVINSTTSIYSLNYLCTLPGACVYDIAAVNGKGFMARDLTFENTAGPSKHQAVALRCDSDLSVFYRCAFEGHQDTLYAHSLRHFYRDCRVTGTVDFVFGNAAAVFQNCTLLARAPLPSQKNSVTAQGRLNATMNTGFAFQFCNVSAHDDLLRAQANQTGGGNQTSTTQIQTYLGRPWKEYSRVVFMQSYIGDVVSNNFA